jgi:hypothetical protein
MGEFIGRQSEQMDRLDPKLLEMGGRKRAELWTEQGLMYAPEWDEIRILAQHCFKELGSD